MEKDKTLTERETHLDDVFTAAVVIAVVFQLLLFVCVDIRFYAMVHFLAILVILFPSVKYYTNRRKIIFFIFAPASSSLIIIAFFVQMKKPGIIADIFSASKKSTEIKRDNL